MLETHRSSQLPLENPFLKRTGEKEAEQSYRNMVQDLAYHSIYRDEPLNNIVGTVTVALKQQPGLRALEDKRREMNALISLLRGIEAHEKANFEHCGSWQAALTRRAKRGPTPKPAETFTREEVADELATFPFREEMLAAEAAALTHYRQCLAYTPDVTVQLTNNISLQRADIEILIIDLETRIAERIVQEEERKARLMELDKQLATLIDGLTDEEWGKKLEFQEIYLLRRLIHATDKGHLASVNHGTPREDLRRDRGLVDMTVTAAGSSPFLFQIKTFKQSVSRTTREKQAQVRERAQERSTDALLVELGTEDVKDAYDASRRQVKGVPTSRRDKYDTLSPIAEALPAEDGQRLLTLLGLTEQELQKEEEERERKQIERQELEAILEQRRAQEQADEVKREKQATDFREAQRLIAEKAAAEVQAKIQNAERLRQEALDASRKAREEAEVHKLKGILSRQAESAEKRAAHEARQRYEAALAQRKLRQEERKNLDKSWPPKQMKGLATAPLLKKLGLLNKTWNGDLAQLNAAKEQFWNVFGQPKGKRKIAAEGDAPNERFATYFPTKESLSNPPEDVVNEIADLLLGGEAEAA